MFQNFKALTYVMKALPVSLSIGTSNKRGDHEHHRQSKRSNGLHQRQRPENGDSLKSKTKAQEGRDLRNEGRIEGGKLPGATQPAQV
ncbi:hypothetical protein [Sphingopyxis panaciterrae]